MEKDSFSSTEDELFILHKDLVIKNRTQTVLKLLMFWFNFFMNKSVIDSSALLVLFLKINDF